MCSHVFSTALVMLSDSRVIPGLFMCYLGLFTGYSCVTPGYSRVISGYSCVIPGLYTRGLLNSCSDFTPILSSTTLTCNVTLLNTDASTRQLVYTSGPTGARSQPRTVVHSIVVCNRIHRGEKVIV